MAAPKGNQYWKLAHDWHKPKLYKPEEILEKALEYIEWCENNPLIESKAFGTGFVAELPKLRATTIQGFCFFANMNPSTWYEYENQEAYSKIIARVKAMFFSQKFEGAASGLLDGNLIAREIGLAEHTISNGSVTQNIVVSDSKTMNEIQKMKEKFDKE